MEPTTDLTRYEIEVDLQTGVIQLRVKDTDLVLEVVEAEDEWAPKE